MPGAVIAMHHPRVGSEAPLLQYDTMPTPSYDQTDDCLQFYDFSR